MCDAVPEPPLKGRDLAARVGKVDRGGAVCGHVARVTRFKSTVTRGNRDVVTVTRGNRDTWQP